jgi:uncharacterized protein (UPF0332 family)
MFYIAQAMLLSKNLRFHRHSGVLSAFGRDIIKAENLPSDLHTYFTSAFNLRNAGDYETMKLISDDDVREKISQAKGFWDFAQGYLKSQGFIE